MPGPSSIDAIPEIRRRSPQTRVVVLTMQDDPAYARAAMQDGASGYVLKESAEAELVAAVRAVAAGATYLNPGLGARLARTPAEPEAPDDLSDREVEVLRLIALGHTNAEIGEQLFLSVRTVETHRRTSSRSSDGPRGRTSSATRSIAGSWRRSRSVEGGIRLAAMKEDRQRVLLDAGRTLVAELDPDASCSGCSRSARELTRRALRGDRRPRRAAASGSSGSSRSGIDEATQRAIGDLPRGPRRARRADPRSAAAAARRRRRAPGVLRLPARAPADAQLPRRADPDPRARRGGTCT